MAREIWFAKQENPEDEWGNGTWDFCVGEIKKSDIDKYKNV